MAELASLRHNGLEFLLDPVDRFPLREVTAGDGQPDQLVLMAVGPSAPARADSSCAVLVGELGSTGEQSNSARKRKQSPTQSVESTGMVNPDAPGWTIRFQYREVSTDFEQPDPFVSMVVGPSAPTRVESSCTVVLGQLGGTAEQSNSAVKRKESPTQSAESTGKVNPEAPEWTRRLRVGRAPPHRAPCPGRGLH